MSVSEFSDGSDKVFKKMQGLTNLKAQKHLYLHPLVSKLKSIYGDKLPLTDLERITYNLYDITSGTFRIDRSALQEHINGLVSFVQGSFNEL